MEHIIIRGPLGVGKSTIAKQLSEKLNYEQVSLDELIEVNGLVPEGVDGVPIESFIEANELIAQLPKHAESPLVIDGCFYYKTQIDDLVNKLDREAKIFTLTCAVEECIRRDSRRTKPYGEDATRFVHMMTDKVKAGVEIDTTKLSVNETVAEIMSALDS